MMYAEAAPRPPKASKNESIGMFLWELAKKDRAPIKWFLARSPEVSKGDVERLIKTGLVQRVLLKGKKDPEGIVLTREGYNILYHGTYGEEIASRVRNWMAPYLRTLLKGGDPEKHRTRIAIAERAGYTLGGFLTERVESFNHKGLTGGEVARLYRAYREKLQARLRSTIIRAMKAGGAVKRICKENKQAGIAAGIFEVDPAGALYLSSDLRWLAFDEELVHVSDDLVFPVLCAVYDAGSNTEIHNIQCDRKMLAYAVRLELVEQTAGTNYRLSPASAFTHEDYVTAMEAAASVVDFFQIHAAECASFRAGWPRQVITGTAYKDFSYAGPRSQRGQKWWPISGSLVQVCHVCRVEARGVEAIDVVFGRRKVKKQFYPHSQCRKCRGKRNKSAQPKPPGPSQMMFEFNGGER